MPRRETFRHWSSFVSAYVVHTYVTMRCTILVFYEAFILSGILSFLTTKILLNSMITHHRFTSSNLTVPLKYVNVVA